MTLAYLPAQPAQGTARDRREARKARDDLARERRRKGVPSHLALLPGCLPVGTVERSLIRDGHPGALSWELLPWEEDDWAWYAVEHQGPLDLVAIGELLGLDESTVGDIEESALSKLQALNPGMTGAQLGRMFAQWDRQRRALRRARECVAVYAFARRFAE